MAKTNKKRARQTKRRAERRKAKKGTDPEPTPGTLLLRRIHTEAHTRYEAAARRRTEAEAEQQRRLERAGARSRTKSKT